MNILSFKCLQIGLLTTAYLFLSFAKNVSGTQIFSAKSPDSVSKSL